MHRTKLFPFMLPMLLFALSDAHGVTAEEESACHEIEGLVHSFFPNQQIERNILQYLDEERRTFRKNDLEVAFCRELVADLKDKISSQKNGLQLTQDVLIQHGILFESFRINSFLSSGVAPKRYFGFFDEQADTANYETILRATVIDGVKIANAVATTLNLKSRIHEEEVAVTFLAEGGALLLTNPEGSPDRVHPVTGIGLDNLRLGLARFPTLMEQFDLFFGTKLHTLFVTIAGRTVLLRPMTFREAILGTTLMYLFEKELTASLMEKEWDVKLMDQSLPVQFISTSLVYNSGILFSQERVKQIETFATGAYLAKTNEESKRPKLAVFPLAESLQRLRDNQLIPTQLTSWNAVYHVLQRYGAWVALEKFSGVFKDGQFTNREHTHKS